MTPQISVILPVYNQERFISETIESVLGQTFQDFELLILDDGSTDLSAEIIREYANRDKRIIPFFKLNSGRCESTNFLVSESKGKWCALMDADDVMLPTRLEKQINYHLVNPKIDASSCHCFYINENGKILGEQRHPFIKNIEEYYIAYKNKEIIQVAITGLFISREIFLNSGGLKSRFWPCDDFEFSNRLIDKKYILVILQEILMKYRIHSSSITVKKPLYTFEMVGYVIECINLRREGKVESSFEEFKKRRDLEAWWIKLNRKRFNYSQIFFRNAGISMMSKNYKTFFFNISIAFFMDPAHVITKLVKLIYK